jgi:hypothetical protein
VDTDEISACKRELFNVPFRLDDHQVYVDGKLRASSNGADDEWPERDVGDEAAIHDIYMDPIGTGLLHLSHFLRQASQVGAEN